MNDVVNPPIMGAAMRFITSAPAHVEREDIYQLCTREYTEGVMHSIKEIGQWLRSLLRKS